MYCRGGGALEMRPVIVTRVPDIVQLFGELYNTIVGGREW
jgi:hypothetical protein